MIVGHPTEEMLAEYAAGSLSDGLSLMVASHLTYCPACRDAVCAFEAVGGAFLTAGPIPGLDVPSLDAVMARIDREGPVERKPGPKPAGVLPAPIRARIGMDERQIAWKFRMPGLAEYPIEGFEGEQVSLLRAKPGAGMFAHTHKGEEATLILAGAMRDGSRVWKRGDVALADQSDDHRPEIVGDETCICLIVMSGNMKFTGRFGRVLNLFTG
jgi:putative transcriptional regulator